MDSQPTTVFQAQIVRYEGEIRGVDQLLAKIAWSRLGLFIVFATLEIYSWQWGGGWWLAILVVFLFAFGMVVKWNQRVNKRMRFFEVLRRINQEELARLEGKLDGMDEGAEFTSRTHPYSSDLDLYGEYSLFSLLSRATTSFGRITLASWLDKSGSREQILARQTAVEELAEKLDWRQGLQAAGRMHENAGEKPEAIAAWMETRPHLLPKPIYKWLPIAWAILFLSVIVLSFAGIVPFYFSLIGVAVSILINRSTIKYSEEVYQSTAAKAKVLKSYAELIERIEGEPFKSAILKDQKAILATEGIPAHKEIQKLARILVNLELRLNGMPYFIMQSIFLWDIIWIRKLESWKHTHKKAIMQWFAVIGEIETLSSLAALRYAHPDWARPEIPESGFALEGSEIGHPMLLPAERVNNPVSLPKKGLIWLITGSNMSGKSTYLRTIGINAILALAGAPVCAKDFRITPLQVASSMRTLDSLEENTSSFYAELKRIKMVIGRVETGEDVLFLLDEILKGTNSRDRHAGARALIRQLQAHGGTGMVSTHDLELVDLAEELPGNVLNYSFNCEVSDAGDLDFNYTLTPGVCHSMNATALMRAMGIKM